MLGGRHPLLEEVTPAELAGELGGPQPPLLVDVRTEAERTIATIDPSLHLDLSELLERAPEEIPADADVVVYCHSGMRSAQVACGSRPTAGRARGASPVASTSGAWWSIPASRGTDGGADGGAGSAVVPRW